VVDRKSTGMLGLGRLMVCDTLGHMLDAHEAPVDHAYDHAEQVPHDEHHSSCQNQTERAYDYPSECCKHL